MAAAVEIDRCRLLRQAARNAIYQSGNRSDCSALLLFFSIYFHSPWLPSGEVKMFSGRVLQLATVTVTIAKEGAARSTAQSKRLLRSHKQMTSIPPLAAAAATAAIVVSVEKPNDVPVYLF